MAVLKMFLVLYPKPSEYYTFRTAKISNNVTIKPLIMNIQTQHNVHIVTELSASLNCDTAANNTKGKGSHGY